MTFLLRRISRAADGHEIVREIAVAADFVTVGRAADNDIVITDLAVAPYHARIERQDERRLAITAALAAPSSSGFTVDGRATRRAIVDPARGAEIVTGDTCIAVSRGTDTGIVLTIASVAGDSAEHDERVFSLAHVLPGKRPSAWLLVVLILGIFLAWPVWHFAHPGKSGVIATQADRSWTPGALSAAHHALERDCAACHVQPFVSVRDTACLACHKDVHDHAPPAWLAGARAPPGAGGQILVAIAHDFNRPDRGACVDCHTEHQGAGPMAPTSQAFCADCHATLKARVADTRLGNASDFGTIHPQFAPLVAVAPGKAPQLARETIGQGLHEENGLKFPHALHLDPRGGVARMSQSLQATNGFGGALGCADCHTPTADGSRFLPVSMERNCQMCHSLAFDRIGGTVRTLRHGDIGQMSADLRAFYRSTGPGRPIELGGMARRRPGLYAQGQVYHAYFGASAARPGSADAAIRKVFSPGGACYDCHVVTPPGTNGSADWGVVPVRQPPRYLMHGWFDHNAHREESCASCHAASVSKSASDVLIPGIVTCRSCHGGEASAAKVPSSCAMCHSYHQKQDAPWRSRRRLSPAASPEVSVPGGESPS
jgi:hypothetical protein